MTKIDGYKTYIVAVLMGLVTIGQQLGYIDSHLAATLQGLLTAGGFAALKSAITKAS